MRRALALSFLALAATAPVEAQRVIDVGVDDRVEALNAVLAFRSDLAGDSTFIARCRIPTAHPDTGIVLGLDPRFQDLLVRPDTVLARPPGSCGVAGFADPKTHVLWLHSLIEINKTGTLGLLPPYLSKQYEITFQLLEGPGYRSYHRYVVEPAAAGPVPGTPSQGLDVVAVRWRVVEYRLTGWDFHWGDNLGHGSGVRRP